MKKPSSRAPNELHTTPRVTTTRCPYCHDDVSPEGSVACQDCLGRHHPACWDEAGACASCGGAQQMRAAPRLLDDASVRRILLSNNYTGEEIDAYLRGEKAAPCRYASCEELGAHRDMWLGNRRVCHAHARRQRTQIIFLIGVGVFVGVFVFNLVLGLGPQ